MDFVDIFRKGGPAMLPLLALSILSLSVIIERLSYWFRILTQEKEIVARILDAAQDNWRNATELAKRFSYQPIGRFLYAPLRLSTPDPEIFRLALESTAEDEIASMRQGEKILEAVVALAPLLGLLGTVLGLIQSLRSIRLGDLGTSSAAGVTLGIGESLISTATGLIVAIVSLVFYRLFQAFVVNQVKIFSKAGSDLELLYRQYWLNIQDTSPSATAASSMPPPSQVPQPRTVQRFTFPPLLGKTNASDSEPPDEQRRTDEGYTMPPYSDRREDPSAPEV